MQNPWGRLTLAREALRPPVASLPESETSRHPQYPTTEEPGPPGLRAGRGPCGPRRPAMGMPDAAIREGNGGGQEAAGLAESWSVA